MNLLLFNQKTDADDPGLGVAVEWIGAFARRVDRVYVITHEAGRLPAWPNVQILSVGRERGWSRLRRLVTFYRSLLAVLRRDRIDGCFVHMIPIFTVLAAPLLKWKRIPIVQWYAHSGTPLALRLAHRLANYVATASPESFRLSSRKVIVTGHGIDTQRFAPGPAPTPREGGLQVLSVGRITPIKHLETVLAAAAVLSGEGHPFRLLIVGGPRTPADRSYAEEMWNRAQALGLRQVVQFKGTVPPADVPAWYRQADLCVNLSDTDSIDKAVLEAMSCGLPVVTSNVAFRPLLVDIAPELLVPKRDAEAVARAILTVAGWGEGRRQAVAQRLREIVVARHNMERLIAVLLALFARLSSAAAAAAPQRFRRPVRTRLQFLRHHLRGRWVLDIGNIGSAASPHPILQASPTLILVGVDVDAQKAVQFRYRRQVAATALALPFRPEVFDTVYAGEVLEHLWDPASALAEAHRVLKPGGRLILDTPNPYALERMLRWFLGAGEAAGDPDHKFFYSAAALERLLAVSGFVLQEITTDAKIGLGPLRLRAPMPLPLFARLGSHLCLVAIRPDGAE